MIKHKQLIFSNILIIKFFKLFIEEDLLKINIFFVVGWGHKSTSDKARLYALQHNLPYIALEDGFLRSLDLGCKGAQPLSLERFPNENLYIKRRIQPHDTSL